MGALSSQYAAEASIDIEEHAFRISSTTECSETATGNVHNVGINHPRS